MPPSSTRVRLTRGGPQETAGPLDSHPAGPERLAAWRQATAEIRLSPDGMPHRPGQPKGKTSIGSNVRVAVDTMFVAPVTVGDDAWTAAGAVITDDVPDNALAGFPPRQVNKEGHGGKRDD